MWRDWESAPVLLKECDLFFLPLTIYISPSSGAVNGPRCEHWIQNAPLLYTSHCTPIWNRVRNLGHTQWTRIIRGAVGNAPGRKKNFKISPAMALGGGKGKVCVFIRWKSIGQNIICWIHLYSVDDLEKKKKELTAVSSALFLFIPFPHRHHYPLFLVPTFSRENRIPNAITFFFFRFLVVVVEWHVDF